MSTLYDLEGFIADFLKTEDTPQTAAPSQPLDLRREPDTLDLYGANITEDRSQTELYELLALMHVPTREIIDPDERAEYENYLAARTKR
ncbi:MAG TPA: hypothetical protein VLN59_15975 [Burkholderiales bacterium]|nr:hypothetical protein [Burkholderiales bacterium]